MKMQQEKQQQWMEMQQKQCDATCTIDSKPKLPRPMLQKIGYLDNSASGNKYKDVMAVILNRFAVNAETYWQRFRRDTKKPGELFKGFLGRQDDKLMRWSDAVGLDMKEVILLEQFLETSTPRDA